ncbi:MAG TPA: patatin-like phospholipase family protein [Stellaceae bacterium]|nr:patatin-like phospholipase family protein [Stellaceae bacterium]
MMLRIGIALGSGSARGWAHIGVLRRLEAAGIVPAVVCGTSMGAIVGGLYAAGRIVELEAWAKKLTRLRMSRHFDFQFGSGGIIAGRRITAVLAQGYGDTLIENLPCAFACVATDVDSGHEVWLRSGRLAEAVRASYAIPGVFPPVARHDRWLVDGGLVNPVPVSLCRALGADVTIAVDLRADRFGPEPGDDGETELAGRGGPVRDSSGRGFVRSYFKRRHGGLSAFGVLTRSLTIIQDRIAKTRLAEDPPEVTIRPGVRTIGALEFYRAADGIAAGADAAEQALPEIHRAIARLGAKSAGRHDPRPLVEAAQ